MEVDRASLTNVEMLYLRHRVRPCTLGNDGRLYRLVDDLTIDIFADPFNWRQVSDRAVAGEFSWEGYTYHIIDSPEGHFTPTIAEVLRQLPDWIDEKKMVFTTQFVGDSLIGDQLYHLALTRLYKVIDAEDDLCAQMKDASLGSCSWN